MDNTTHLKLFRLGKILLLMIAYCCPLAGVILVVQSLSVPYLKDLRQGYLLAQAMVHGVDPYLPLPELGKLWLPGHAFIGLHHPSPHPFAVGWLCLPLALLRYEQAAVVWLLFQLGCLALSVVLLLRILGLAWRKPRVVAISFLMLGWWPLILDLWFGQLNLCLLVLFLAAWRVLRRRKDVSGGALLGSLLLLKMAGWPIVLWLALQRRWRAVWAAGLFWAAAHLLAIGLHGWEMVRDYYLKVGPQVGAIYHVREINLSAWTIGQRLFNESGQDFVSLPLWKSPLLVKALTALVPLVVLILALRAAVRLRNFDTAFALLMGIGVVLNPVAWQHYLLLAAPALALLLRRLHTLHWPRWMTCGVISLAVAFSLPHSLYVDLAELFAVGVNAAGKPIVPALPALLTFTTSVALCVSLWLLVKLESGIEAVAPEDVAIECGGNRTLRNLSPASQHKIREAHET